MVPATTAGRVRPEWFNEFLDARGTSKPSRHTLDAYCRDFDGIATIIVGDQDVAEMRLADITRDSLRTAFSIFAAGHAAASARRCWSTWNTLCTWLYSSEFIASNPMAMVDRAKADKSLPKALSANVIDAVLGVLDAAETQPQRRDDWVHRDRALVLTALLAGLRLDELVGMNISDVYVADSGSGVLHVRGKGRKDRRVPIEAPLVSVIEAYLASRIIRFPGGRRRHSPGGGRVSWPAAAPLFVSAKNETRITRSTVQYRVLRLFRRAGVSTEAGALVHGLRHTFATDLANADVSVYELKNLLGHESLATSQRYVDGAGRETRAAAARNPLYKRMIGDD